MTRSVRASRDGDQFHYLWASRRCLLLLDPGSGLVAISIEGISPDEASHAPRIDSSEHEIDVAEYHGDECLARAQLVRYIQLKHSTLRSEQPWTASGLNKTLSGFAARYRHLRSEFSPDDLENRFKFCFITNRPVSPKVRAVVDEVRHGQLTRYPGELAKLKRITSLQKDDLSMFCRLLRFEDCRGDYWAQRNLLRSDVGHYLPGLDNDAPFLLKELVTRRALSEAIPNPVIKKADVLHALGASEGQLYPAPSLIESIDNVVPRGQHEELSKEILQAGGNPVIVHASAGVGKTVFATRIERGLPIGSVRILYDCFGNGSYRSRSTPRHRHKDGLVQIANELAAKGLCHPIVPANGADVSDYSRAFIHRLRQAMDSIHTGGPNSILCIVIDAADNAQMAAQEACEEPSFVRDLLREQLPPGVQLVVLCRTHRLNSLNPPNHARRFDLGPFDTTETTTHLRQFYPNASQQDADEFHQRTSRNPRVQALALADAPTLPLEIVLRKLGPGETDVEGILEVALWQLIDDVTNDEQKHLDWICIGLSTLRPGIPVSVLARFAKAPESEIINFAQTPELCLIHDDNLLQFRDESVETWFQKKFRPSGEALQETIRRLKPLASESAYVALSLPQLMLAADQIGELIKLALASNAIPEANELEMHEVEHQRLQFALKACLRSKRYVDAAKLSFKAGWQTAGQSRRRYLIQNNADLTARFCRTNPVQELVVTQELDSNWPPSRYVFQAFLLSAHEHQLGEARSRLRVAHDLLRAWNLGPPDWQEDSMPSLTDIAQLVIAELNTNGAKSAIRTLQKVPSIMNGANLTPRNFTIDVIGIVVRRLLNHGRFSELDSLAAEAENYFDVLQAIIEELGCAYCKPSRETVKYALQFILPLTKPPYNTKPESAPDVRLCALKHLAHAGLKLSLISRADAGNLLSYFLPPVPPRGLSSRTFGMQSLHLESSSRRSEYLPAYCCKAVLTNQPLRVIDLAYPKLREKIEQNADKDYSSEASIFNLEIGALLPWYLLREEVILKTVTENRLQSQLAKVLQESESTIRSSGVDPKIRNEIALIWCDIICCSGFANQKALADFKFWITNLHQPLYPRTLITMARCAAWKSTTQGFALELAHSAFELCRKYRGDADSWAKDYIDIARAVLPVSEDEAATYFNEALKISDKVGDESYQCWDAILRLAECSTASNRRESEVAYRFARCAELMLNYIGEDENIHWDSTVGALASLCPNSSLAILSRWRDRGIGYTERNLPIATHSLINNNNIDPRDAIALVGFRANWDYAELLGSALEKCEEGPEKQVLFEYLIRYAKLVRLSSTEWRQLQAVVQQHNLVHSDLEAYEEFAANNETSEEEQSSSSPASDETEDRPANYDWNTIFADCDLTTSDGVSRSYDKYKAANGSQGQFFAEAIKRVPAGREPNFIDAVVDTSSDSLYAFRHLLRQIPETSRSRPAIKKKLKSTAKAICRQRSMSIKRNRLYEVPPFDSEFRLAGLNDSDIVDEVLAGVGTSIDLVDSDRLFSLVGLIVLKLAQDEALEVLRFGLDQFDLVLEDSDGDGDWSEELAPPLSIRESIAGYIFAGLAAPSATLRWEASHTVLGVCALERKNILRHLVRFATDGQGGPFVDARLQFYKMHAHQWLLIAFARAATEFPSALAPHGSCIIDWALEGQPHVMIRMLAARAALALIKNNVIAPNEDFANRLSNVTERALSVTESTLSMYKHVVTESGGNGFNFGIDIGPYWYKELGRVFALSQGDIETAARSVIRKELLPPRYDDWPEDHRARRGLYTGLQAYAPKGTYPDVDDILYYFAYHAMMIVAGRLLSITPSHLNLESDWQDEFDEWFSRHDLTRDDGRWLADRRDPPPLERPDWLERKQDDREYDLITEADLGQALLSDNALNVWGRWSTANSVRVQSVEVRSALVSPDKSMALQRAFSDAKGLHDCFVPSSNTDVDIFDSLRLQNDADQFGYVLDGWIEEHHCDSGLDGKDRWSGEIHYPPPAPSPITVSLMALETDLDKREWRDHVKRTTLLTSQVWGQYQERGSAHEHERGNRLQASVRFVKDMLRERELDLIVVIEINRRRIDLRYQGWPLNDEQNCKSIGIYVVKADGSVTSI